MLLTVIIGMRSKNEIVNKINELTINASITNINLNSSNEPQPIRLGKDSLRMITDLSFVRHVQPTVFKNGLLKTETENEGILLKGVGRSYDFSFIKKHLVEGSMLEFKD